MHYTQKNIYIEQSLAQSYPGWMSDAERTFNSVNIAEYREWLEILLAAWMLWSHRESKQHLNQTLHLVVELFWYSTIIYDIFSHLVVNLYRFRAWGAFARAHFEICTRLKSITSCSIAQHRRMYFCVLLMSRTVADSPEKIYAMINIELIFGLKCLNISPQMCTNLN